ncbi:MAG: GspE/PulE family protein [Patescibacteria group bacterium]|nr:GspE/PulE family protein [Patescibacteria group bacterium]
MKTLADIKSQLTKARREAEERDAKRVAEKNNLPYADMSAKPVSVEALNLIPEEIAKKNKIAVIEALKGKAAIVVCDPNSEGVKQILKEIELKGYKPAIFVVSEYSFNRVLNFYKFVSQKQEKISGKIETGKEMGLNSLKKIEEALKTIPFNTLNVGKIFEIVLNGALANRASDIHFEPEEKIVKLRLRIDGALHDVLNDINKEFYSALLSRIKLLSNLKINVRDEAQDGRFTIKSVSKEIEVRVAIAPSEFGEVAVMRILDPDAISLSLSDLGLRDDDLKIIEAELKRPNGMILNTGPTGSGKTTTLYAFLKHKKNPEIKIITIEDPIEYHLEGIEQTQVDEEAGYTFANGLRSLMRQDPDIILVGEMRDKETSEIGIQAALTGHLVFSTIHANSAAAAIPRLLDLGVKPTSIGPALNLVIAQRLVRRLCQNCKASAEISGDLRIKIEKFLSDLPTRVNKGNYKDIKIFSPSENGCEKCNNSKYKGRVAIYELLLNDPEYEKIMAGEKAEELSSHKELEELILQQAGETAIKKFSQEQGMVTMQEDGILKVISGMTTFEEVESMTGSIIWK